MSATLSAEVLRQLLDCSPEAIAVADSPADGAAQHLLYVNRRFEELTGVTAAALLGTDLRKLPHVASAGRHFQQVHHALLRDAAGVATHSIHYFRAAGSKAALRHVLAGESRIAPAVAAVVAPASGAEQTATMPQPRWLREDRLTGLNSRQSFEELLNMQWQQCQRQGHAMTLLMFEIDSLNTYRETFDRNAVDACVRKVGRLLSTSFRRGSDVLARWDEGSFCVVAQSNDAFATAEYAQQLANRVTEMQLHHPRGARGRFVSVSVGIASMVPAIDLTVDALLTLATRAVRQARAQPGGNVALELAPLASPA
jgi:diguanylate cyclase (GGDEF)-like protein/PAS domain S-box-containing protein